MPRHTQPIPTKGKRGKRRKRRIWKASNWQLSATRRISTWQTHRPRILPHPAVVSGDMESRHWAGVGIRSPFPRFKRKRERVRLGVKKYLGRVFFFVAEQVQTSKKGTRTPRPPPDCFVFSSFCFRARCRCGVKVLVALRLFLNRRIDLFFSV